MCPAAATCVCGELSTTQIPGTSQGPSGRASIEVLVLRHCGQWYALVPSELDTDHLEPVLAVCTPVGRPAWSLLPQQACAPPALKQPAALQHALAAGLPETAALVLTCTLRCSHWGTSASKLDCAAACAHEAAAQAAGWPQTASLSGLCGMDSAQPETPLLPGLRLQRTFTFVQVMGEPQAGLGRGLRKWAARTWLGSEQL